MSFRISTTDGDKIIHRVLTGESDNTQVSLDIKAEDKTNKAVHSTVLTYVEVLLELEHPEGENYILLNDKIALCRLTVSIKKKKVASRKQTFVKEFFKQLQETKQL